MTGDEIKQCMMERRGKIVYLTPQEMINHFQPAKKGHLRVPQFLNIPEDAIVFNVQHDFDMGAFKFLIYHTSFPKVEEAGRFPILGREIRIIEVKLDKDRPERLEE